ncbi:MAG: aminotransferase class V-fold PLP-dependent enzyme [Planctomycetia bacterium]
MPTDHYGNAGSVTHEPGREARAAVGAARGAFAGVFGGAAGEIVFTGGATESNNLALRGAARRWKNLARAGAGHGHVVTWRPSTTPFSIPATTSNDRAWP